jgi:hypothetical protein
MVLNINNSFKKNLSGFTYLPAVLRPELKHIGPTQANVMHTQNHQPIPYP